MNSRTTWMNKFILTILTSLLISTSLLAGNYTWNGGTSTAWGTSTNWTPNGTPSTNDTVTIVTGSNNVYIAAKTEVKLLTMTSGTLNLQTNELSVGANSFFNGGTVTNGLLTLIGTNHTFAGSTISTKVSARCTRVFLNGSVFNDSLKIVIPSTGRVHASKGGNTFNGPVSITDSAIAGITLADSLPDIFNSTLDLYNASTANIFIAHKATGCQFNGTVSFNGPNIYSNYYGSATYTSNIILNNASGNFFFGYSTGSCTLTAGNKISIGGSGMSSGQLYLRNFTSLDSSSKITLNMTGTAKLYFESGSVFYDSITASVPSLYLNGSKFHGVTILESTGSSNVTSTGGCSFYKKMSFENKLSTSAIYSFANAQTDTFLMSSSFINRGGTFTINKGLFYGKCSIDNKAASVGEGFYIASTGTCTFKDSLYFIEINSPGVRFGNSGGITVLDSNSTFATETGTGGIVFMQNVSKLSSSTLTMEESPSELTLTSGNSFNGNFYFHGNSVISAGTTFNSAATLKLHATSNVTFGGGNTFNGTTIIQDSSSTAHNTFLANSSGDDYNADVTFIQKGTSVNLYPSYTKNSTFSGNIITDGTSSMQFGGNGGKVVIDGTSAQSINRGTTSLYPTIKKLQVNKASNSLTLNSPITVSDSLQLTNGRINTDTTNLLSISHGGKLVGGSDSTYINGPLKKTGNSAFTFAVGSSSLAHPYHPIEITAPTSSTDAYTAHYFPTGQTIGTAIDSTIDNLNACQYWNLTRNSGTSKVKVKLNWNNDSCETISPTNFRVTGWNGSMWEDLGNAATTGDSIVGTVQSGDSLNSISSMTLAFLKCSAFRKTVLHENVRCKDGSDGSAIVTVKGGTGNYKYSWSTSLSIGGNNTISNVKSGTYYLEILDDNGCILKDTIEISEPNSISIVSSFIHSGCLDSTGTISVTPSGGVGGFKYYWMYDGSTSSSLSNIPSGEYTILITDSNGCAITSEYFLSDSTGPGANIVSQVNLDCYGLDTAYVEVEGADANAPFIYQWTRSEFDTTGILENIRAGEYIVKITNSLGCISYDTISITSPEKIIIDLASTTTACGSSTGTITATITGGIRPYAYSWSRSISTDSVITGLSSGTDTLIVMDANGCISSSTTQVLNSTGLSISTTVLSNVICFPDSLGSATVVVSGGTPPYTYNWNPGGGTTNTVYGLPCDNYSVTVIDANGCRKSAFFYIEGVEELKIYQQIVTPTNDSSYDGKARAIITGGTSPYELNWSNGSTVDSILDLGIENDTLIVTDNNGCIASSVFRIINNPLNTCSDCSLNSSCGPFSHLPCTGCTSVVKNIKIDFGAVGNGIANDQCAFEEAASYFASLPFNIPKRLEIPSGTYIVGRQEPSIDYALEGATVLCFQNINNMEIVGKIVGGVLPKLKFYDCIKYGAFDFPSDPNARYLTCPTAGHPCYLNVFSTYYATPGNMIHFNGCKNISIKNIELDGNMDETIIGGGFTETMQVPTRGIFLNACQNITIDNVNVHDFGYDGITVYYMDCTTASQFPPHYPPIMNCNISNSFFTRNGRNNMTWGGGIGMNVFKTEFNLAGQGRLTSQPASGIDIEFENSNIPTTRGRFTKCKFKYNRICGINSNSDQNGTQGVQFDYRFLGCLVVASETGNAAWPNARGFKFTSCDFVGRLLWSYASILGTNTFNPDNTEFDLCTFDEEYLDSDILPWQRKSFAPTVDEGALCPVPEHLMMLDFGWTLRTNFNRCTFNTNYTLKFLSLSQERFQNNELVSTFNFNSINDCSFFNHGLNACDCDWELSYINYTDFNLDWQSFWVIGSGMRNQPAGIGCPNTYYYGSINTANNPGPNRGNCINLAGVTRDWRHSPIHPVASKYLDPIHPRRETEFFWCSPCPKIVSPTYYSCEPPERRSNLNEYKNVINSDINIIPNPSTSLVYLIGAENLKYRIFDSFGQQVMTGVSKSAEYLINIDSFKTGIYIIEVENSKSKRFIKM